MRDMKKYCTLLSIFALILGCSEKLLEKPDDLIPEDKMVEVLTDLAIVNAAKSTSLALLQDNNIEPMTYIYEQHDIDSIQLVESDRYYASLPVKYEQIYKQVEAKLDKQAKDIEDTKKVNDSLRRVELENKGGETYLDKMKDSLS